MMSRHLALLSVALLLACGGAKKHAEDPSSAAAASPGEAREGPAEVGKPAPDLSIQSLNDKGPVKLEGLGGKVVIVDFWATWCGPCRQSFPGLEALSKRHAGQVTVVGVSVNEEQDGITDFAKEMGATFPVAWDKGHAIADRWKVATMPSSYILDGTGTVRFVHAGFHEGDEVALEKEVASLLGKAAPAEPKREAPATAAPAPSSDEPAAEAPKPPPPPRARPAKKTTKKKRVKKPTKIQPAAGA